MWRQEWDPPSTEDPVAETCKLKGVFAAFAELGVSAEPVVFSDASTASVRDQLLGLDGVLAWVNPIEQGLDRSRLDPLLQEAADAGVFVSAHPAVILRMGTKQVLVDTRAMPWGTDTRIHRTVGELRERLLLDPEAIVLKQRRGMGGQGVWKVEADGGGTLTVRHAAGGAAPERTTLDEFCARCEPYFAGEGFMVEQPYQPRLAEGMIRAYLCHDRVVGFAHQYPRGLLPPDVEPRPPTKVFEVPDEPEYREIRLRLENEWVPEMQQILGIETHALPVIWDADFLHGDDGYVLCEINVSSTFAFPEFAMPQVARAALDRIGSRER